MRDPAGGHASDTSRGTRGGGGWIDIDYRLTVDINATPDDYRYVVEDHSEQGGEARLCTNDADEVASWIESEIEDKGDE